MNKLKKKLLMYQKNDKFQNSLIYKINVFL